MKRVVDKAIVLGRVNYAEADRIVTMLTSNGGKLTLIAKGSRRLKSKLAGGIEPLALNEVTYMPGKSGMGTLVSSRMKENYSAFVGSHDVSRTVLAFSKWLNDHLEDGTGEEYFDVLYGAYRLLHLGRSSKLVYIYFYTRYFLLSGQGIDLSSDTSGKPLSADMQYMFDHDSSGFVARDGAVYGADHIKLLRLVVASDPEVLSRLNENAAVVGEVKNLVHEYMSYL
ncbi:MAG: DNA repair protein RecO [Patescibacteria group bacterium]